MSRIDAWLQRTNVICRVGQSRKFRNFRPFSLITKTVLRSTWLDRAHLERSTDSGERLNGELLCSTAQSPRAANAFSSACAARTCPAPDDADKSSTRGFGFIRAALRFRRGASRGFAAPGGYLFQNASRHALQLAEARQIILKFVL